MERYFIDDHDGQYELHDRTLGHDTLLGGFPRKQAELAQRVCALLNADEESQRVYRILQAREVLGDEIVDTKEGTAE